jgi:hypothetical protein
MWGPLGFPWVSPETTLVGSPCVHQGRPLGLSTGRELLGVLLKGPLGRPLGGSTGVTPGVYPEVSLVGFPVGSTGRIDGVPSRVTRGGPLCGPPGGPGAA